MNTFYSTVVSLVTVCLLAACSGADGSPSVDEGSVEVEADARATEGAPQLELTGDGCKTNWDCNAGYVCVHMGFNKKCVLPCQNDAFGNSNCPSDQVCRQPLGTTFPRCVN
jgi:hypothetical protein